MKKVVLSTIAMVALSASSALAADLPVKAVPVAAPPPPAWDIAAGAAIMSDYVFRGVSQSNRKASVAAYFEPRYKIGDIELYAGIAGESISFPNRAAAEIDLYGGFRPTFGKLALDFGVWYYWYPGGTCFNGAVAACQATLPNGNVIKRDLSFWEVYGKATYNVTDALAVGVAIYYSPSVLNSGASGIYYSVNGKYTAPAFASGITPYISGEFGFWSLGTSDAFYAVAGFPAGIPYKDYATWNVGVGLVYKVLTLDFRYHDTNLNKGDCNAFTSDHTATGVFTTAINPGGPGSKWCGATFVVKGALDITLNTNIK
jgi:uncharacterized protein (TIGR02001 family)